MKQILLNWVHFKLNECANDEQREQKHKWCPFCLFGIPIGCKVDNNVSEKLMIKNCLFFILFCDDERWIYEEKPN